MKRISQSGLTRFLKNRLSEDFLVIAESFESKYNIKRSDLFEVEKITYNNANRTIFETDFLSELTRVRLNS